MKILLATHARLHVFTYHGFVVCLAKSVLWLCVSVLNEVQETTRGPSRLNRNSLREKEGKG